MRGQKKWYVLGVGTYKVRVEDRDRVLMTARAEIDRITGATSIYDHHHSSTRGTRG